MGTGLPSDPCRWYETATPPQRLTSDYTSRTSSVYQLFPARQRPVHHGLRLADNRLQVGLVLEAFRVDFVDIFRPRRPGREPAVGRYHLQAADRCVVARG